MRDAEILERLAAPRTARDLRDAAVLTLLLHGITPAEVSRLELGDVFHRGGGFYSVIVTDRRGRRGQSPLDLPSSVRVLNYLRQQRRREVGTPMFTGRDGKAISAHQVNSIRRRLRRKVR